MRMKEMSRVILLALLLALVSTAQSKKRVCIIGAGMAGLAATKLSSDFENDFETVTFEKNSDVGGLWIYTDSTDVDEHGLPVHSSMYKNLRANLPKQVMAYPDYLQFTGREDRSFVTHDLVLEYMRNYTDHFNLRQYIKLNTLVEKVVPVDNKSKGAANWRIQTRNLNTNKTDETICDSVIVCNGHFSKPYIPKIPGIESFAGQVLHSHVYRVPEPFAGKTVVVLGASSSASDISIEVSSYAKTVYLSHRHDKLPRNFPENIVQVKGVVAASDGELILQDDSRLRADAFIYCTGYLYDFPFLDSSSDIFIDDNHVRPLYKHLVNVEHPSMAFIGLANFVVKGALYYSQVKYYLSYLRGNVQLPSYEEMIEDSKTLPEDTPKHQAQHLTFTQWDYNDELAEEGGFEPLPSFYKKAFELYLPMERNLVDYKEYDLKFLDNGDPIYERRPKA